MSRDQGLVGLFVGPFAHCTLAARNFYAKRNVLFCTVLFNDDERVRFGGTGSEAIRPLFELGLAGRRDSSRLMKCSQSCQLAGDFRIAIAVLGLAGLPSHQLRQLGDGGVGFVNENFWIEQAFV